MRQIAIGGKSVYATFVPGNAFRRRLASVVPRAFFAYPVPSKTFGRIVGKTNGEPAQASFPK